MCSEREKSRRQERSKALAGHWVGLTPWGVLKHSLHHGAVPPSSGGSPVSQSLELWGVGHGTTSYRRKLLLAEGSPPGKGVSS